MLLAEINIFDMINTKEGSNYKKDAENSATGDRESKKGSR